MAEDVAGGAADQHLSPARVPVGAHNQHIGFLALHRRQKLGAGAALLRRFVEEAWRDAMPGERFGDGRIAIERRRPMVRLFVYGKQRHLLRPAQEGQRPAHRAPGLRALLPADEDAGAEAVGRFPGC